MWQQSNRNSKSLSTTSPPRRTTIPVLRYLFTAWLAITLTFIALRLIPGDAIEIQLRQTATSRDQITAQQARFNLDDPVHIQYLDYLRDLMRGDFGRSLISHESVFTMIKDRTAPTLILALTSLLTAVCFGLTLGMMASLDALPDSKTGGIPQTTALMSLTGSSIITLSLAAPVYWTATLAIYFSTRYFIGLNLPAGGTQGFRSLILPTLVLGFGICGGIARITETALRESLKQPFIQTAQAKGLSRLRLFEHALRASLLPILSIIALQAGFLLSGTVIIEIIFTRRGIGSLLHQAVLDQDYPVVQALVLLAALIYTLTRAAARFLEPYADPRIRNREPGR